MLFEYNKFWQTLLIIVGSWALWGIWGGEFAIVTLLALLLSNSIDKHIS